MLSTTLKRKDYKMCTVNNKNEVKLTGNLVALKKVWSSDEQSIYEGVLQVTRDSGVVDNIPILTNRNDLSIDQFVSVCGQFRSRDITLNDGKLKVQLYVCAKEINTIEDNTYFNNVCLQGYICKKPTLRTTPSGKQVSDLLIACNYNKDKTAYIPTIVWGKFARKVGKLNVGTLVSINGRFQSRKYTKEINGSIEEFTAYELSASSITPIEQIN